MKIDQINKMLNNYSNYEDGMPIKIGKFDLLELLYAAKEVAEIEVARNERFAAENNMLSLPLFFEDWHNPEAEQVEKLKNCVENLLESDRRQRLTQEEYEILRTYVGKHPVGDPLEIAAICRKYPCATPLAVEKSQKVTLRFSRNNPDFCVHFFVDENNTLLGADSEYHWGKKHSTSHLPLQVAQKFWQQYCQM